MAKDRIGRALALSIFLVIVSVNGEYFGRNKVQYDRFNFKMMETDHFSIMYYPSELEAVKDAGRMLERWNTRYAQIFGKPISKGQPIILYANQADFQQTNAISGLIQQGTGGVTEGYMNRIILPLTGIYEENDHVLGHELVHAFQYEILKSSGIGLGGESGVPLWFIEGMAEYLSIGSYSQLTSMWMRDAVLFKDVPTIRDIERNSKYFPYRYGQAIWAFIGGKFGDAVIGPLYMAIIQGDMEIAFRDILGVNLDKLSKMWVRETNEWYCAQIKDRQLPSSIGRRILEREELSLSPVISPNGKMVAVFSSKDLFAIDLYIIDLEKGEVIRRLGSAESDAHFDALRYVSSTGSWSPDSKRYAFVTYKKGNNSIGVFDVEKGRYVETYTLKNVDEIYDLAWSPDGEYIAVSGANGGENNLYLYSIKNDSTKQLTKGKYAELMPSWSPDGKALLFITDRGGGTDFDSLTYGPMKIGKLILESNEISLLSMAPWVTHINPQFSRDGKNIFFVANPDGISNLYRYSTETDNFYKLTNIATGVSGLTELSSAMSIAHENDQIVLNVFEKSGYKIQMVDSLNDKGSLFVPSQNAYLQNIKLPPGNGDGSIVNKYLEKPREGLITGETFLLKNYKPRLRLLYIGQMYGGVSADPLGVGVAGGLSFIFSDILGGHLFGFGAQVSGSIRDFGGEIFYLNMNQRLNWGVTVNRLAYLTTRTNVEPATDTTTGETVQKINFLDQHIYDNNISFMLEFPLSTFRRFELTGGFTRESYDYRVEEVFVSGNTVIQDETRKVRAPSALNLFQNTLAYVGDFSFFGFTGPVSGRRFRLEIGPTYGTLNFLTLLADYRQYIFMNPFTLAFRFFHYGRYLKDAGNVRLPELYLGYETWVRGYEYYSFDLARCSEKNDNEGCPQYNRLLGSRVGVMNMELRFPLIGVEKFGLINFRYLPVDLITFLDGGVAWNGNDKPIAKIVKSTDERIPVFSVGGGTRINILGLLILQIYYAYPFQRTDKHGHFGFVFAPAW